MQTFLTNQTFIILNLILQNGPPVPGDGDTAIDELPVDDYLYIGIIMAIVIGFIAIYEMRKSYQKA